MTGSIRVDETIAKEAGARYGTAGMSTAQSAVRDLLEYIGEDVTREGLIDTPKRVAAAWLEMTSGYLEDPAVVLATTFDEGADELVVVRGIEFASLCEHHVLPFTGTATVGYLPGLNHEYGPDRRRRVVGLSKLARLVAVYARRLQVQERLTREIAEALMVHVAPQGVGVVLRATHSCMSCRGVGKTAEMVTSAMLGTLREDGAQRAEFMALERGS